MSKAYAEAYQNSLHNIGSAVGAGLQAAANHSAKAAATANGVSAASQAAQGSFNQNSVNNANAIGTGRIADQWGFNSSQAAMANQFSMDMWQRSADFNAEQAEIQRQWQERMDNTKYQRAIKDMEAAGLNPVLAVTGGGISTGTGSSSAASISPISGQAASGSIMNGLSASEGNYTGQMEYMGGLLGLLSAAMNGISTAVKSFGQMGLTGEATVKVIHEMFNGVNSNEVKEDTKNFFTDRDKWNSKYPDSDNAFNRYYNPSSKYWIGNHKRNIK